MTLYSLALKGNHFTMKKFDEDINLLAQYSIEIGPRAGLTCDCPQAINRKAWCRHLDMIQTNFLPTFHVGDGYLFCYETREWMEPPL